jgi:hypothetical protein
LGRYGYPSSKLACKSEKKQGASLSFDTFVNCSKKSVKMLSLINRIQNRFLTNGPEVHQGHLSYFSLSIKSLGSSLPVDIFERFRSCYEFSPCKLKCVLYYDRPEGLSYRILQTNLTSMNNDKLMRPRFM